ncbi:MAG TPA: MFS transporter [Candidatus Acidoferrum sp.]|nr:MFS transporter [Candidatus Acidoferrum sp.]
MSEGQNQRADTRSLVILAFSATAGVLVEFYDFFIYGYAAASAFPAIFFPKLPPTQALLFSYLAFGAGFPARLIGAFIFGHFGDRTGRKFSFLLNIAIVGVTTCLTGLLPGYATLGIAAPVLLVVLRIVQGIGLGGEFGGASSLLAEFGAERKSRAFWMSLASLGVPLGAMAASGVMLILSKTFATTGWRIGMLLSVLIVVPALLARYKLADSPFFERLKQQEQLAALPSLTVLKEHRTSIVLVGLVVSFMTMDGYVMGTYFISFMKFVGIPLTTTAFILLLGRIADALGVLLTGPLADFCKRRMAAYIAVGLATLLSYPFVLAVLHKRIGLAIALQIPISFFGIGVTHGLAPILASENFPTKFRYSGAGISLSVAGILGGMIAPSLLAGFIGQDVYRRWYFVPLLYAFYCAAAMLALYFMRETRDVSLQDLDRPESGLAFAEAPGGALPDRPSGASR